ncbi:hypothetical protein C8F04DRAFT_1183066 [Mycena alexandri]|uniref:F-box domain-containing protein n=1 Tax=Mycena alexandri TaxID=1745969 RepID=A0AAD6X3T1_9AGAR|nr:hypothetical protein C8F04DRAFT_1183066 [Mycena alexandri]
MPDFDFPPEISLQIFPHLRLKGLISARGVCKRWKELVALADIHPTRLALLKLYQKTVHDPLFLPTRPWTLANLRPFDRQAYINALLVQHDYIPEDFCLWILEIAGCNFLGRIPPVLHKITLDLTEICLPDVSSDGEGEMDHLHRNPDGSFPTDEQRAEKEEWDSEEYYRTREKFTYSPPPSDDPVNITSPALLVWERDDIHQTFLALVPETPFSVYIIPDVMYLSGDSRQYTTWISWLEAQFRRIHRQASYGQGPVVPPPFYDENGEIVPENLYFQAQPRFAGIWTAEDEARFRAT